MSILIKGMEMPHACCDCDLLPDVIDCDGQWECPITEKIVHKYVEKRKGKPPDCPLVEIPPHGRLIDGDKLEDVLSGLGDRAYRRTKGTIMDAQKFLSYAPTVIEVEERRDDRDPTESGN